ncbi:GGDEF domain-containing response regulator [Argonema antarcticum]|uniref:GGDEF domain-containing response regulator n=1 Tax=Argonema antarcticum TaxID=2942763 RepID=UPI0020128F5F|nr:GGDEF domain-containing response regulator [Argonema antarcticum]MCL1471549.1 EAL domain-containing protein [Argonema antarcticum A004/B2]
MLTKNARIESATILVVEDESIVAIDIQNILENLGYKVPAIADTGNEAIQKADEIKPCLVLMDIRLKGEIDGIEAAEQILLRFDIPVIYLTAYADEETLSRAKKTSPFGYIIKPFEERELNIAIDMAIYKHKMEKQIKENAKWLSTVLKSIGDGVIANDTKACVTFMNPIAEALTGWQQSDAIGKNSTEVFNIVDEITRITIESPVIKALNEGKILSLPEQTLLIARNGAEVPIGDSVAPIKDDRENVMGAVLVFWDMTERREAKEKLRYQAFHDALTGLPNRALFLERLDRAFKRAKRHHDYLFAVLFLDVDRFKIINDSFGHAIGDRLLIAIAQRLENSLRSADTVARLGGDEFAILLEDIENINDACRAADRILSELSSPFNIDVYETFTNASIGIVCSLSNYEQAEDLIRDADIAMYRAKSLGKGRYQVFDTAMHLQVITLSHLENDLRRAIDRCEFQVYYQPIVSLATNKIVGFEALVRWQHPQRGLIAPGEFIPLAQETGAIVQIDFWVMRSACLQTRLWQQQIPTSSALTISVNLCSKHFAQSNLIEQIDRVLQDTGLDASSLKLEITESAIIENAESAAATLSQLRALGIQLSIDDFGTGYSSLSYLHRFPVNTLKIDRSFINNMGEDRESSEIVRTIVMLAHNLGIDVIAEGIETRQQLVKLRELQCEYGQGYLFSRPLPSPEAEQLIAIEQGR